MKIWHDAYAVIYDGFEGIKPTVLRVYDNMDDAMFYQGTLQDSAPHIYENTRVVETYFLERSKDDLD